MRSVSRVLAGLATAGLFAAPALAQTSQAPSSKLSLGFTAGLYSLSGDDFEDVKSGWHFEGTGRYMVSPQVSILGGIGYNINSTEVSDVSLNVWRIEVQPRYMFRMSDPKITPWVGAQIEWHRYSTEFGGDDVNASGFGFGGLGGVTYWTSPKLGVEVSAAFYSISFGDASVAGETVSGTDASGTALGLQVGVVFKLGTR